MKRVAPALVALALLGGCGASKQATAAATSTTVMASTTTTSFSIADLAKQYEDAVAAGNAAGDTFSAKMAKLAPDASGTTVADIAEPLASSREAASEVLLRMAWPDRMRPAVNAVVTADTILVSDLRSIRNQTLFSASNFVQQFINDAAKVRAAVSILRADLGLPPVTE